MDRNWAELCYLPCRAVRCLPRLENGTNVSVNLARLSGIVGEKEGQNRKRREGDIPQKSKFRLRSPRRGAGGSYPLRTRPWMAGNPIPHTHDGSIFNEQAWLGRIIQWQYHLISMAEERLFVSLCLVS